jgi:hypothetical protein
VDSDESLFLRTFFYPNGSYDIQHSAGGSEEGGADVATGSTQRGGVEGKKGTLSCTGPLPRVVGWETNERCPQITLCFVLVMIETALFLFQDFVSAL